MTRQVPLVLHELFEKAETAADRALYQYLCERWKGGNWFGLSTTRIVEILDFYFDPMALPSILAIFLGPDVWTIVVDYAMADCSLSKDIGFIFQDEKDVLWDKCLGRPIEWLLRRLCNHPHILSCVETIRSPGDKTVTRFSQDSSEVKFVKPANKNARWTLVILHNKEKGFYEKLFKGYRSHFSLQFFDGRKLCLREPAPEMALKKKKMVKDNLVRVVEVVRLNEVNISDLVYCFYPLAHEVVPQAKKPIPAGSGLFSSVAERLKPHYRLSSDCSRPVRQPNHDRHREEYALAICGPASHTRTGPCSRHCLGGSCYNDKCSNYCFDRDCLLLRSDGALAKASNILPGDFMQGQTPHGQRVVVEVLGVVQEVVDRCVHMVEVLPGSWLTPGHPIQINVDDNFVRPKWLFLPQKRNVVAVYNFVLSQPICLILRSLDNSQEISCSTLGQFCAGIDTKNSFFGSTQVLRECRAHATWPFIKNISSRQ